MSKKKKKVSQNNDNDTISKSEEKRKEIESKKEATEEIKRTEVSDTTSLSVIKEEDLNDLIAEDLGEKKEGKKTTLKPKKHILVHLFLILVLICSLVLFTFTILDKSSSIIELVSSLLITLFTVLFVVITISYHRKSKGLIFISGIVLLGYILLGITNSFDVTTVTSKTVEDFSGKSLSYVVRWAAANNVKINQEYEFSDMVSEYKIISQDIESGKKLKDIQELTVSVSEGPNPSKEIIIPSMISWDCERVLAFVRDNYLSNVEVEFVESDKAVDTVIEQNTSGSLKRDDKLKLTFSYGEELGYDEVTLIDFTGKSQFEAEFYMKQHQLRYEFDRDFSKKEKRGFAIDQSIEAGKKVKVNDEKIKVTISKGPKIVVPNLEKMDITEITEWAIQNKLKLEFSDKYDDSVKENNVISTNLKEKDVIEQGDTVKVVLSRGSLKMPKFKSFSDFRDWANKYEIHYEEKHEFSDSVEVGEVISYSYKKGEIIKNDDTIIVTISDGKKCEVPNLKGLTKKEAISKLEKADLKYNFVYKNSSSVSKDKVISQSISAGSKISKGTTITVTLSNGKKDNGKNQNHDKDDDNHSSDSGSSTKPSPSPSPSPKPSPSPTPTCTKETVYIYDELISSNPSSTCSKIKSAYSNLKFSCSYVEDGGLANGLLKNSGSVDGKTFSTCDTISLVIVKND